MPEPHLRLDALTQAATVQLLAAEGDGDGASLWGSGFFVAPGWVLTCAHVLMPHVGRDLGRVFAVRGAELNDGIPVAARLDQWLVTDAGRSVVPPHEDLALVRLVGAEGEEEGAEEGEGEYRDAYGDRYEHECVWLADRAVRHLGPVTVYGYQPDEAGGRAAGAKPWSAEAETNARDGDCGLRLAPDVAFPKGVSGGPLLDPRTGAVVGLVKARRKERDGGLAIALPALRRFGARYREVMAAHDRWHATSPRPVVGDNWIDEQQRLLGSDPRPGPEDWTPKDRRAALGLLAGLPAPAAAPSVARLVRKVRGRKPPGAPPSLLGWRDGHGLLYDGELPQDALTFLHYLRLVALYVRERGGDAGALERWVSARLGEDDRTHLHALVTDARLPDALLPAPEAPPRSLVAYPGPGEGPTVTVLLDPVIGARPARFHWQIWVNDSVYDGETHMVAEDYSGEGFLPKDLVQSLRDPLARTLHGQDGEGPPVPLEFALPAEHFDTQVHRWRLDDIGLLYASEHLSTQRAVVLRALTRRGEPDKEWGDRWRALTEAGGVTAARVPVRDSRPQARHLSRLPHAAVPVMCRPAGRGTGREVMRLVLGTGHGVALWDIDGHATRGCHDSCDALHARVERLFGGLDSVAELPDRLRHIRHHISQGGDGGHWRWAEPMALLYDDPRRPLPPEDTTPADSP
ncbi:trypsin-like peptidase domain-containing protein [Streptomyces sp. NPDC059009]|uniref:VMAP-C domain-containing protein n=1 Tax=Streptomyces sp. NPDC059009 TaxID=3346694 RepID=UPI0036C45318